MRLRPSILALLSLIAAYHSNPARAWGRAGHQIVCAIAWEGLNPAALAQVKRILEIDTREQFAPLCNWADEYRSAHGETTGWHYVDVPVSR